LVWASIVTYIIPVVALFLAMGIAHQYGLGVGIQATAALIAFLASLALVRWIGKSFKGPKIIEK
ncbi:MAG TPA: hypothetical protein ENG28_01500, partial [Deltaproteobacteria bacterium]|nr:hypothetical protein [Deltaproteobacteria bacterium]